MNYKKCEDCGSNLDHGEKCDCLAEQYEIEHTVTFEKILEWAKENESGCPKLSGLTEEAIGGSQILKLPVPWGKYTGLIISFDYRAAQALRGYDGYAVAWARNTGQAKLFLRECAEWKGRSKA